MNKAQTQAFPQTPAERLEPVRLYLVSCVEKAVKSVDTATQKLAETEDLLEDLEATIAKLKATHAPAEGMVALAQDTIDELATPVVVDKVTGEIAAIDDVGHAVLVRWPCDECDADPRRVQVGPHTRFGELAANFIASLPDDDPRRKDYYTDYRVVDAETQAQRLLEATIPPAAYGREFSVEKIAVEVEA